MRTPLLLTTSSLLFYLLLIGPFAGYLQNRPFIERIGYVPSFKVLKLVAADHKEVTASFLVMKVLMYFGGLIELTQNEVAVAPDYPAMSRLIHNAVELDPYNMDAYYFAQAILSWDVGRVDLANKLLDHGMQYRTWDWQLPYFAGFNHAYFLKDYATASRYYQRAGELSGFDLYKNLAGRYMQEAGRTELAIRYLSTLEQGEKNLAIKKSYQLRLIAFQEVQRIEVARDEYQKKFGRLPASIDQLVQEGLLTPPVDPYGGNFYLQPDGKVATTSKFAFATKEGSEPAQK